ncbi:MAG TPA: heterocyst frequency control protein PatD [Allocoleopsis sp.]
MLPTQYLRDYQDLYQAIQQLQQQCDFQPTMQPSGLQAEARSHFQQVQQLFQQILALPWDELDPQMTAPAQAINIEINKQLRLLNMDLMFLGSARQAVTATQRQQQLRDRLTLLLRYCEAILQEESSP